MAVIARKPLSQIIICVLGGLSLCPGTTGFAQSDTADRTVYQQWVEAHARKAMKDEDGTPLKLLVMEVEGEEKPFGRSGLIHGTELSADGHVAQFRESVFGGSGSRGGEPIPAADLKRLEEVLAKLPDDGSRLPPAERRVMLEAFVGDRMIVRVYDRAKLSADVLETLQLSRCHVAPWVPEFQPESVLKAHGYGADGFCSVMPDGQQILFTSLNGPLQFYEPATHELLREVPDISGEAIAFSPDQSLAAIAHWGECSVMDTHSWKVIRQFSELPIEGHWRRLLSPVFTPDGRHLLLQCTEPSLKIFDVRTWNPVGHLPAIPEGALAFVGDSKDGRAVIRSKEGNVEVWDTRQQRRIAKVDEGRFLARTAFSPDESRVAIVTAERIDFVTPWKGERIRVFDADTGRLLHELRAFEQPSCELISGLMWTFDGEYLLAATSHGISLWNVKTGRHCGEFTGCYRPNGIALLPDSSKLVAGGTDCKIRFWDFQDRMKQVREFEDFLQLPAAGKRESTPTTQSRSR